MKYGWIVEVRVEGRGQWEPVLQTNHSTRMFLDEKKAEKELKELRELWKRFTNNKYRMRRMT